jgi:hypothetical protein
MISDVQKQIELLPKYFSTNEVILYGGLSIHLNTRGSRQTSDADLILLQKNKKEIYRKIERYTRETGIWVDCSTPEELASALDLGNNIEFLNSICKTDTFPNGSLKYLGPEAMYITKLISMCSSGEDYQPTRFGIKVLRDKDLEDLIQLEKKCDLNKSTMIKLLSFSPYLSVCLFDENKFIQDSRDIINDKNLPEVIRRNAYGIAKANNFSRDPESLHQLILKGSKMETPQFAIWLDQNQVYHQ